MQKEINSIQLPKSLDLNNIQNKDITQNKPEEIKPKTEPAPPKELDGKSNAQCYEEYCKLYFTNIVLTNQVPHSHSSRHCSERKTNYSTKSRNTRYATHQNNRRPETITPSIAQWSEERKKVSNLHRGTEEPPWKSTGTTDAPSNRAAKAMGPKDLSTST